MPPHKPPQPEGTLTLEQAARRLGIAMSDVYPEVHDHRPASRPHGSRVLWEESAVNAFARASAGASPSL